MSVDCESSFVRRIGAQGVNEESFNLIPDGVGNFFLAGMAGNKSLITQLDASGNIIAQRTYDFTNSNDFIACLMVDDQGFLVGSARDQLNSNTTNVQFKINWQTGNVIWAKKVDNPAYNRFDRVFMHPTNGNYLFCGMTTGAVDNYIIQMDKTNGNVVWQYGSDYGDNGDVYSGFATTPTAIYYAGQGRLGGGLDDIRPTLTKFDLNGNLQWARIHLRSPSQASRLYNMDIFIENDTIVNCGRGSLVSDDLTTSQLLFYKTNINGGLIWAKSYTVNNGSTVAGYRVRPIPNGYIVQGSYLDGSTTRFFVARFNKQGNVVWAKELNIVAAGSGITKPLIEIDGGFVYFAAQTSQYDTGQNNDLLFGKIPLDGQIAPSNCPLIEDITLVEHNIANAYDGSQVPNSFTPSYLYQNSSHNPGVANLPLNEIPGCECTEFSVDTCSNGIPIHTVPDALLQSISAECLSGSIALTLVICNADSVELPANTPISFYSGNPTTTPADLLDIDFLPFALPPGNCLEFTTSLQLPTNQQIFAVVNDNGTTPTPFELTADFPNTAMQECDFTNNIASFTVNYTPPVLDLGPDISGCNFSTTELDAGPGFVSYHWSNGNAAQTLTATQPGTYSVTVTDQCGGTQSDEITLNLDPATIVEIGIDTAEICEGSSATFSVSGFSSYQWSPADLVDCPTCPTVNASPSTDTCLIVVATDNNGCYSADTVCILIVTDTATNYQNLVICEGDTTDFFGTMLSQPGTYTAIDTTGNCVEVTNLTLAFFPKTTIEFETETACPLLFDGSVTAIPSGGAPPYSFHWENDTVFNNQLTHLDVGTYSVTVTDQSGCAVVDSVTLGAAMRPDVTSEVENASCFGVNDGTLTIVAEDPTLQFSVQGSPISSQVFYDSIFAGSYQYFVIDTFGCIWEEVYFITAPNKIVLQLPNSIEAPMCDSVQLNASSTTSPLTWSWSPPDFLNCTDCPDPIASPFTTTTYHLMVSDSNGCKALDSIVVKVDFEGKAYIPNAFSPNGDGINDVFYVLGKCVEKVKLLRVFDRWGEMVFEKSNTPPNDPLYGWDGKFRGKDMNPDVFVYYAVVVLPDGTMLDLQGDLTLLR